jgi:two-component system, cell cycle sensor histidine kinase and response regulator CckA
MGQPVRFAFSASEELDPQLLKAAFEASSEGFALAEGGRIRYANQAFAKLLNFQNASELQGRLLASFRPPGHPCALTGGANSSRQRSNTHLCQFSSMQKDGKLYRVETSCTAFQSDGREFLALTARDVSVRERRRVLRDEDRRFRVIFDAAPMGIVQCDMEGRVLETNPALQHMLGYTGEEVRQMHLGDFTHPDDAAKNQELFEQLAAGKRDSYELELRYRGKDASTRWVRLNVSLVRGVDRRPQFAIGMTEDVTERKRAEQRLRESQKMEVVGRLVGGVAHDFNNLLTGVTLYCDLLLAGLPKESRFRHHAEEIHMAGEQGAALIQQLMAISRQQVLEPRILCLNDAISKTRNLLSRLLGEKFELVTRLDEQLGHVKMDAAQVQQILFNLVLNARDAMNQGGCILVETSNSELSPAGTLLSNRVPAVALTVTDAGCGMDADTLSHLFEPFFTTKANGRGTGLGLATVYNIVRNSGGTIEVDSKPGQGTRFRVSLPRVAGPAALEKIQAAQSPKTVNETILLVEDNLAVRQAAYRTLSECGYQVLEAGSGAEAITVSREHSEPIHLLLADVFMPGMNGREVARQLITERPELKVLYMSGYEPAADASTEKSDPVVVFKKPFTGAALLEKSREILDAGHPKSPKKSGKRKREKS